MTLQPRSRRQLLAASAVAVAGAAGCVSDEPEATAPTDTGGTPETVTSTPTATQTPADGIGLVSLSVADFIRYPLSGTHPHVHRRAGKQYVVVRLATGMEWGPVSDGLTLDLDGEPAALAERQPVSWNHDDLEVAFAVSKDREVERGELRFEGETVRTLSTATVTRLNNPPVFEVASPSLSPSEVQSGAVVTAMVTFTLSNHGPGAGTFGASLKGNYVSGANTVTATLEAGAQQEVSASVKLHGEGEDATVRLDWGADEWVGGVPVVGTETG